MAPLELLVAQEGDEGVHEGEVIEVAEALACDLPDLVEVVGGHAAKEGPPRLAVEGDEAVVGAADGQRRTEQQRVDTVLVVDGSEKLDRKSVV